jgi:hypothetical protein
MEHRHTKREQVSFAVVLNHDTMGEIQGVARDLSSEGMYIEEAEQPLRLNMMVTIQFNVGDTTVVKDAIVVHSSKNGAGVLFNQPMLMDADALA